jgi:hypothetical protein
MVMARVSEQNDSMYTGEANGTKGCTGESDRVEKATNTVDAFRG